MLGLASMLFIAFIFGVYIGYVVCSDTESKQRKLLIDQNDLLRKFAENNDKLRKENIELMEKILESKR